MFRAAAYGCAALAFLLLATTAVERVVWRGKVLPGVELIGVSASGRPADTVTDEVADVAARFETEAIDVVAGSTALRLDPEEIALRVDQAETAEAVQDAGRNGNPLAQVSGTVLRRARPDEVSWHIGYDEEALEAALARWEEEVRAGASDGALEFRGATVVPVEPEAGVELDRPHADRVLVDALRRGRRGTIRLPVRELRPEITSAEVMAAAEEARALLASAVTVAVEDVRVRLRPRELGSMLRSEIVDSDLELTVDLDTLRDALGEEAAALEGEPEDARFVVDGASVDIRPHVVARTLDLEQIADGILSGTRLVEGDLVEEEPETTTADLEALGVEERVSSFTTHHPAGQPRVANIHKAAEIVDGTIVGPGEAFSLNEKLEQRTRERGFVIAPVIYGGEYTEDVGGGISQFATTFFNAIFFGGYPIDTYQAHSFYISRYPMGREATISWPNPDLAFTNDTDAAILIRTFVSATAVTVSFYSTEIRDVDAEGPVVLETIPIPEEFVADPSVERGQRDVKEQGFEGRVVRVTRVVRDLEGEEIDRRVFTTRYRPGERVVHVHPCDHPNEAERPPAEECEQPDDTTTTTAPDDGGGDDGGGDDGGASSEGG